MTEAEIERAKIYIGDDFLLKKDAVSRSHGSVSLYLDGEIVRMLHFSSKKHRLEICESFKRECENIKRRTYLTITLDRQ